MPFEYTRATPAAPSFLISRQLGLLLLRLTAGGSLLYWHAGGQIPAAWSHIWHKTPWELPGQLASLGFPLPLPLAILAILLVLLGALGLVVGLLTRLSAILLGIITGLTALLYFHYPAILEPAILLSGLCFALCLTGPGTFAIDHLLRHATRRS